MIFEKLINLSSDFAKIHENAITWKIVENIFESLAKSNKNKNLHFKANIHYPYPNEYIKIKSIATKRQLIQK